VVLIILCEPDALVENSDTYGITLSFSEPAGTGSLWGEYPQKMKGQSV